MNLIHIERVKTNREAFDAKVQSISRALGINPNWLMQAMFQESGLDSTAVNPISKAVGLIQFMPATATGLGTSTDALRKMSNIEQLNYVQKYLSTYKGKIKSFVDLYMCIFFPVAIGKPGDFVLETRNLSAEKIAKQNGIYDLNKDGKITKAEVEAAILKKVPVTWLPTFKTAATVGGGLLGIVAFFLSSVIF
jgi:hypothetical protein